jgi:DsbC/DsbD-like thiol-disulfide interchange protein
MSAIRPITFCLSLALAAPAVAGPVNQWHDTHGARVRIVTEPSPDEEGILRGALEIRLDPGWKTYWRDPGDSGVPPSIAVQGRGNVAQPVIGFPPPERFDDGYSLFAGYDETVAFALSFPVEDPEAGLDFTAELFLGICETICIPVQASLDIAPARMSGEDARIVGEAFARLPDEPHDGFRATTVELRQGRLIVAATLPEGIVDADLYVAGSKYHIMGLPQRMEGTAPRFAVPIHASDGAPGSVRLHYTLVAGGNAVAGTLNLPE